MRVEAEFEFGADAANLEKIYTAVKEERADESDKKRSFVNIELEGTKLDIHICGDDIVRLRAAVNTWLRLVKIAEEMIELCQPRTF
ncbi:KEOPS complex subunit Pcc1 [Methanophagales archaeon]|jgi:KEOPS complex subunit Pcc1|nr:KEOPS complex subunit Pcc1 [Methanophagales archaeon]